jgi:phospholipid-transporting ATPase
VGDLIELRDGQTIPADSLLIATEHDTSQCFVLTSSLDGEKNLKPKLALKTIQDNLPSLLKEGGSTQLEVSMPKADRNLYNFNGVVNYGVGSEKVRTFDIELKQFLHSVRYSYFLIYI